MTGPDARRIALGWALEDFGAVFAKWTDDDVPDDLPIYEKD